MKLNSEKYPFIVAFEKLFGLLVSNRGSKVNLDQIKAIKGISDVLTSKKGKG